MSVIYVFISLMMFIMQFMLQFTCYELILTPYEDKSSRLTRTIIVFVFSSVAMGIKVSGLFPMVISCILDSVLVIVFFIAFLHIFYKEKFLIKLIHYLVINFQGILADVIYKVTSNNIISETEGYSYGNIEAAESIIGVTLIFILINTVYTIIFIKLKKKGDRKIKPIIVVIFFLLILFAVIINQFMNKDTDKYMSFVAVYTTFICATFIMYLGVSESQRIKDELKNMELIMEEEKLHYENIEIKSEEMSKIRHDYNNVLSSVKYLLNKGKVEEATNIIEELVDKINMTKDYYYCNIPIINAVINEKKKICDDNNIALNVDIKIPENVKVKGLDLCMVFGNILDNAIRSCKEVALESKDADINIIGRQVKEYIIFKCSNTSMPNPEGTIKGTGYGMKILADIAKKYNGELHKEIMEGRYEVRISLRNIEKQ